MILNTTSPIAIFGGLRTHRELVRIFVGNTQFETQLYLNQDAAEAGIPIATGGNEKPIF